MSNIIDLLERLGQDARLHEATHAEIDQLLQDAGASADVRAAVAAGDQRRLESLLDISSNVCCLIFMPREQPNEQESPDKVRQPEPGEEELVPAFSNLGRVASG
jgi:hypothetical protein